MPFMAILSEQWQQANSNSTPETFRESLLEVVRGSIQQKETNKKPSIFRKSENQRDTASIYIRTISSWCGRDDNVRTQKFCWKRGVTICGQIMFSTIAGVTDSVRQENNLDYLSEEQDVLPFKETLTGGTFK
jgi:hypothetical protein